MVLIEHSGAPLRGGACRVCTPRTLCPKYIAPAVTAPLQVLEWRIGRLRVRGLDLDLNGQRLSLGDDGWVLAIAILILILIVIVIFGDSLLATMAGY